MDRDTIFALVCAALFAANRTDRHPTEVSEDVARTLEEGRLMTDAIVEDLARREPEVSA